MQSGALRVPQVDLPSALTSVAPDLKDFDAVVVFWEEAPQTSSLKAALADARAKIANRIETATPSAEAAPSTFVEPFAGDFRPIRVACVVGPEGGLSQSEVEMLLAANSNAHLASMGPSILRTETAGVVACALCIYELGGLGAGGLQIATNKAVSEV
jgi:16S rRNA (uracil1498-N3)-methyltransferase